jgi:hypothetical protein
MALADQTAASVITTISLAKMVGHRELSVSLPGGQIRSSIIWANMGRYKFGVQQSWTTNRRAEFRHQQSWAAPSALLT